MVGGAVRPPEGLAFVAIEHLEDRQDAMVRNRLAYWPGDGLNRVDEGILRAHPGG
jgi:hypothetical protein